MNVKIGITFAGLLCLYSLVVARAFWIQVLGRDKLLSYSQKQTLRKKTIYPHRLGLVDREGRPLAINQHNYRLFILPRQVEGRRETLKQVSKIIPNLDYKELKEKLGKRKKFTWLARSVFLSTEQKGQLKRIKGVYFEPQVTRFYPQAESAGQILGFVGVDGKGLGGVEYAWDDELRGEPQVIRYIRDAKGRPLKLETTAGKLKTSPIRLSIDLKIQSLAESLLKQAIEQHEAKGGGIGVMDAKTGELWAMANYPFFNPNEAMQVGPQRRKLSFVTDPFEPGSVLKSLTIASALHHHVVTPETAYYCEKGSLMVEGHEISEAETTEKFEWLKVEEILIKSSNVGTTKIAFDLGEKRLTESFRTFGLGSKTGLNFPGESRGIILPIEKIRPLNLSNMSFGHSIATTPIQILQAYATFANGGFLVSPTLRKQDTTSSISKKRVLSAELAQEMTSILVKAVAEGTGKNAQIESCPIAGKTSTAQRVSPEGGYDGHIAGFVGYPVLQDRPFVVFVYVDRPEKDGYYGGQVAAPVFQTLVRSVLFKKEQFRPLTQAPPLSSSPKKNVGQVEDKLRQKSSAVSRPDSFPSFHGLDKYSAQSLAEDLGVELKISGHGVVSEQWPAKGDSWYKGQEVQLIFRPPVYD